MLQTREINPQEPYASLYRGLIEDFVQVGSLSRRFVTYIPDGTRSAAAAVFVLGENQSTADTLLIDSGWRELADREKIILFLLEPLNGKWNEDEEYDRASGDVSYVNAVLTKSLERIYHGTHESRYYIFGEKEGGTIAHMAAMNPAKDMSATAIIWAGVATVNAGDISESYLRECKNDHAVNLMGAWDTENCLNLKKGDIPMPVWMIGKTEHACGILSYWREANRAYDVKQHPGGTTEYFRTEAVEHPFNQDKRAYRVWQSPEAAVQNMTNAELADFIWTEFLSRHLRWMGNPGGELRFHADPVRDLGMEYHMEEIDGWMREWYVHVPDSVRKNPAAAVPLVFALHGYSCSGEIYIGNSGWHQIADENGFIAVFPTALPGRLTVKTITTDPNNMPMPAWNFLHNMPNGPDEFSFFRTLIGKVSEKYTIDKRRIYVTGHSHGSMMTQALAFGMPEVFAAAAPCSGVILDLMYDDFLKLPEVQSDKGPLPIWMFAGNKEQWLINPVPTMANATGKTLDIWHKKNALPGNAKQQFEADRSQQTEGRHDLIYRDSHGRPMLCFTVVDNFPHATNPEMSRRIWNEFFSHWSGTGAERIYK